MAKRMAVIEQKGNCCASVLASSLDPSQAVDLAEAFNALGDPIRLRIFNFVAAAPDGEVCVCDLVEPVGRSQGTVSHHLKVLSDAGLAHGERRGKWVWYSVDRERLASLRSAL